MNGNVDGAGLAERRERPLDLLSGVAVAVQRRVLVVDDDDVPRTLNDGAFHHCMNENHDQGSKETPHGDDTVSSSLGLLEFLLLTVQPEQHSKVRIGDMSP